MHIGLVFAISLILLFIGIFKGLHPDCRTENLIMRPILYVVFGIGVIGLLSTFILTLDAKGFAEYWVKEEMRVIKNPGDGDYYLDLGENYYKMHHF